MKTTLILLLGLAMLASCENGTDPDSGGFDEDGPVDTLEVGGFVRKGYNQYRRGVQIAVIQYNQTNPFSDEWVTLQTNSKVSLAGWYLDAGDTSQRFLLTSDITDSLVIYTHDDKDLIGVRDTGLALSASTFIWNNSTPDTAYLYDDKGELVDWLAYKGK